MWFNFDCCGMVCASITHALLVYAQYVVTYVILLPWFEMSVEGMVHQTIFTAFIFLGQWSHLRAMTTDPGKVPHNAVPGEHVPLNTLSVQRASVGFRGASSRSAPGSQRLTPSACVLCACQSGGRTSGVPTGTRTTSERAGATHALAATNRRDHITAPSAVGASAVWITTARGLTTASGRSTRSTSFCAFAVSAT
jgi:hypothetical protein